MRKLMKNKRIFHAIAIILNTSTTLLYNQKPAAQAPIVDPSTYRIIKGYTGPAGNDSNPCIKNVPQAFNAINNHDSPYIIPFRINIFCPETTIAGVKKTLIEPKRMVSSAYGTSKPQTIVQVATDWMKKGEKNQTRLNHFQTIKQLSYHTGHGNYMVILGGTYTTSPIESHLFIAHNPNRPTRKLGNWKNQNGWRIVQTLRLNQGSIPEKFWHPSGMDILGNYAIIPLQSWKIDDKTLISFWNFSNPERPKKVGRDIVHDGGYAATSITKLADGYFLVAAVGGRNFDFYRSKTKSLSGGFIKIASQVTGPYGGLQNINFVNDCNGNIYLLGANNTDERAPIYQGRNRAYLMRVIYKKKEVTVGAASSPIQLSMLLAPQAIIKIAPVATRDFNCGGWNCNFRAAANSLFIPTDADYKLGILSIYHWLLGGAPFGVNDDRYMNCTYFFPDL